MTEDPRGRGYPDLAKPETRVANVWRQMWTELRVHGPTKAVRAQKVLNATRITIRHRRR